MAEAHPIPSNPRFKNLTNRRFGRLLVISYQGRIGENAHWECLCDCGNIRICTSGNLSRGNSKSCGCLRKDLIQQESLNTQESAEYRSWCNAKTRCTNPNARNWHRYGGRGITMCQEWINSFSSFLQYLGPKPSEKHSLDRIDNNKGYEPGNVRWATPKQQARNMVSNNSITFNGKTMCATDWTAELGLKKWTIVNRLKYGWSIERALSTPYHPAGGCR